jgi:hypothetical protein
VIRWSGAPQLVAALLRDVVTPAVGIVLAVLEVVGDDPTDWARVVLIGGMIGTPALTFLDWRQRGELGPTAPSSTGSGGTGG